MCGESSRKYYKYFSRLFIATFPVILATTSNKKTNEHLYNIFNHYLFLRDKKQAKNLSQFLAINNKRKTNHISTSTDPPHLPSHVPPNVLLRRALFLALIYFPVYTPRHDILWIEILSKHLREKIKTILHFDIKHQLSYWASASSCVWW